MRTRAFYLATMLALSACADGLQTAVPTPTSHPVSTTTTTTLPPTTTTPVTTTTTTTLATPSTTLTDDGAMLISHELPFTSELNLDVFSPTAPGPFPVVVVFHGGGWVGGHPSEIAPLARELAAAGAVVFNAPYRLAMRGGGYPMTFEDASCAVRFARRHAPQFGGDPASVTVVGYSAGAHIGAVTALAGDSFAGDCTVGSGSALPDAFVGVAGPYDTNVLDPVLLIFFGSDRAEDPAAWANGNPYTHLGSNPELVVRLIQGKLDLLVPAGFATDFQRALLEAGYDSQLTIIDDGNHASVVNPLTDGVEVIREVLSISG